MIETEFKLPPLLGISGFKGSGKTTVGRMLAARTRLPVHHLADPIKAIVRQIDPYDSDGILLSTHTEIGGEGRAKSHHDKYRHTLRELGEGVRAIMPSIWLAALAELSAGAPLVIVPDVRLPIEADQCQAVINVTRPTVVSDGHNTERDISTLATHHLVNDGDLADLAQKVDRIVEDLGLEPNEY